MQSQESPPLFDARKERGHSQLTEFCTSDRIALRQELTQVERLAAEWNEHTASMRYVQGGKMCGQQRVDGTLVPSSLVCLPAIVPKFCFHGISLCAGGQSVRSAILKGRGEARQGKVKGERSVVESGP